MSKVEQRKQDLGMNSHVAEVVVYKETSLDMSMELAEYVHGTG